MLRAAAGSQSRGFRYLFIIWFGVTAFLIVGTLAVGAPSAAGQPFRINNQSDQEPAATSAARPRLAPSEMYPSVSYGAAIWSVVSSRLIPHAETASSRPIVVVEAIVTNTTADVDLRIRAGDVAIAWPDGRRDHVDRFEQVDGFRSFTVEPGDQAPVTLVFKPTVNTDPIMATMALEIQEPGRTPAAVPLEGPAPAADFPIVGAVDNAQTVIDDPGNVGSQLIFSPRTASLALDAGPYRASVGELLTIVEVSVKRVVSDADAAYLQPDFWRLELGGNSLMPVRVSQSANPAVNEDEVTLLFLVADDGPAKNEMTLNVGFGESVGVSGGVGQGAHAVTFPRVSE